MASMQDGVNFSTHPYSKVLLLGAIAAASAFVVTILIVVLCVGCQRKGKTHNGTGEERKHRLMDMSILKQSKLRSIKSSKKNRPASMDLLLLPSRRSNSDLRAQGRQLPQIPAGEDGEHTYAEVGRRSSPTRGSEDARYGVGGRAGETDTPAPPAVPANTPAPPDPDGDCLEGGIPEAETLPQVVNTPPQPQDTVEYACIRKVRRVDKAAQKRDNGTDTEEGLGQQRHSSGDIRHAPPTHQAPPPMHPHSQKMPRKNLETFNLPTFPKEAVFMGNGEQYIWKPPEDDDFIFQHKQMGMLSLHAGESMAASAAGITEMYSKVCKTGKKKRAMPGSPTAARDISGFRTLARGDRGDRDGGFSVVVKPQTWAPQEGKGSRVPPGCMEDHCYEAISTEETDLAYDTMEGGGGWRGGHRPPPNASATLRPKRKRPQQPLQQPPPPPPPPLQNPKIQHLSAKGLVLPGESLYESIPDLKQSSATSSTTTIFTFNDGMEMYVTGL
ncbi:uncharacterized protein si:dkey-70p6.1 isoform X2 [Triplophysa rosa]|uniref:uncharacterized protein si:dkey-70p6.1 isoform X2 n=1 Tax=Triplophysa rosa TaxID=992332 RepID=UPI002545F2A3|nr:uncharacterized protein si:dkey-70p6.1 isoform X2 [Triplophysa rosa]